MPPRGWCTSYVETTEKIHLSVFCAEMWATRNISVYPTHSHNPYRGVYIYAMSGVVWCSFSRRHHHFLCVHSLHRVDGVKDEQTGSTRVVSLRNVAHFRVGCPGNSSAFRLLAGRRERNALEQIV